MKSRLVGKRVPQQKNDAQELSSELLQAVAGGVQLQADTNNERNTQNNNNERNGSKLVSDGMLA
ncbi:hypothetical protein [Pelomonas sp. BJYL3]|uniref:hypothetical protein n=1 Tax=Pelomonas sp. BJYL3 TaxID=2976697 RepID=UPI0022B50B6C|nr:hypothetical protein [Pelomonas sp. BJYL3]